MKQFLRRISPRRAVADFADHWSQPTPHRWPIVGVALAMTFALFMLFIPENQRVEFKSPDVIYIQTFDETRSEAEIIASNCANQRLNNYIRERLAQREELRRDIYKALGRATFVDVDEIEQAAAQERAEAAAAAERDREKAGFAEENIGLSFDEYCARAAA